MVLYTKSMALLLAFLLITPPIFKNKSKHPLHVSTTEINYNVKNKQLEITCKIFTDDFETALTKASTYGTKKIDLIAPAAHKAMDEYVKNYLNTNLIFKVNGKFLIPTYLGFEQDNEVTNVYLELDNVLTLQNLSLSNSILFNLFDDQMNILHVEKGGIRKSVKTNYPNKEQTVVFN